MDCIDSSLLGKADQPETAKQLQHKKILIQKTQDFSGSSGHQKVKLKIVPYKSKKPEGIFVLESFPFLEKDMKSECLASSSAKRGKNVRLSVLLSVHSNPPPHLPPSVLVSSFLIAKKNLKAVIFFDPCLFVYSPVSRVFLCFSSPQIHCL